MDMFDNKIIRVEMPEYYDGWIAEYNTKTKDVVIRDFWVTEKWTKDEKEKVMLKIKKAMG